MKHRLKKGIALAMTVVTGLSGAMASAAAEEGAKYEETLTLDVFAHYSNYQGIQPGWFGKVVKDKFNIELNLISPNVAGDSIYQTRAAAGELGDIIAITYDKMKDCIDAGIIYDMTEFAQNSEILKPYMAGAESLAEYFGKEGQVYAFPSLAAKDTSDFTAPAIIRAGAPEQGYYTRWDYYYELGCPELNNLEDILEVSKQMQEAHPTSDSGKPTYAFSVFKDWDSLGMSEVEHWVTAYGYGKHNGFVFYKADPTDYFEPTDKEGMYYKILKTFNKADQMGLMDPDSATQNFDELNAKIADGQIFNTTFPILMYNTVEHTSEGRGHLFVPVGDMDYAPGGQTMYGQGGAMAMGANCKDPERVFEFFEWLASDEAMLIVKAGLEGWTYEFVDGKPQLTEYGAAAFAGGDPQNIPVPEEYGGGSFVDGVSKIVDQLDFWTDINPEIGEPYDCSLWSNTLANNKNLMNEQWSEVYGYDWPLDMAKDKGQLHAMPGLPYWQSPDPSDIRTIRSQCCDVLQEYSWKMLFAENDEEFDNLWDEMKETMDGFGYQDVLAFDMEGLAEIQKLTVEFNEQYN